MRELAVSPEFTPEEQEIVIEAADEWFLAVPEARVPIVISEDRGNGAIEIGSKKECRKKGRAGRTKIRPGKAPVVRICASKLNPELFRAAVLHELGHALARRGKHLADGTVMSERLEDASHGITEMDVEYVRH
jgi:hypothetical protein